MNVDRLQQIPFSGASQFESGVCHLERPPIQDIVFKTKIRTDEKPLQVYPQKNFVMGERKNQNQKKTNHLETQLNPPLSTIYGFMSPKN